jgi:perosamine synthetase
MAQVEHDRVGFNYRLSDLQAAIGIAQVERLGELLNARDNVAALYRERLTQLGAEPAGEDEEGDIVLPSENSGDERRSWFVFVIQLPEGADRDAVIASLGERGIASKAYLPCIHLLPPYRERFGFKGGEFPIAERVANRSLALPFFTSMTEGQVDRVCTALGEALGIRP